MRAHTHSHPHVHACTYMHMHTHMLTRTHARTHTQFGGSGSESAYILFYRSMRSVVDLFDNNHSSAPQVPIHMVRGGGGRER